MVSEQEIIDLSSLGDSQAALRTAAAILGHKDPCSQIDRLYPALLRHQTLITAMAHLERAGADLERLTLSASLFRNLHPLNILLPLADQVSADRIPLAAVRGQLEDHRLLLRRVGRDIARVGDRVRTIFLFGRAIEAAYPEYPHRNHYDTDVLTPDIDSGLRLFYYLRAHWGVVLFRCKVSRLRLGWLAHFGCATQSDSGHMLTTDIIMRGRPFGAGPGILPPFYHEALFPRLREVTWSGHSVWVPSAEDMLLTLAEKIHRHGWISRKDFNDTQVILSTDKDVIDWDYLYREAAHLQLGGILHFLITDVEARTGRKFAPPDLLVQLAPGRLEKRFLCLAQSATGIHPATGQRRERGGFIRQNWRKFWIAHFLLRYAKSGPPMSRIAALVLRDSIQAILFRAELRLARTGAPAFLLSILRTLRGGNGSVCELRRCAASTAATYCLSQDAGSRTPLRANIDAEACHVLERIAGMIPLPADIDRVCPGLGGRKEALRSRLVHHCSAYGFSIGMTLANQESREGKGCASSSPKSSSGS